MNRESFDELLDWAGRAFELLASHRDAVLVRRKLTDDYQDERGNPLVLLHDFRFAFQD